MMYNPEHYRDATAGLALRHIAWQEMRENRRYRLAYIAPGYGMAAPICRKRTIIIIKVRQPDLPRR